MGAGYVVAAPTLFNLLQSCKSEPGIAWKPVFLNETNGYALTQALEVILPKTDTPGAGELNIAAFIDIYMNDVAKEKQQSEFTAGANALAINFKSTFNKDIADGSREEFEEIVGKYLGAEKSVQDQYWERLSARQDPEGPELEIDTEASSYGYLSAVRDMGVWAWKNSEAVGENVLWYDPIPGAYIGCLPLDEAGDGKVMSL